MEALFIKEVKGLVEKIGLCHFGLDMD